MSFLISQTLISEYSYIANYTHVANWSLYRAYIATFIQICIIIASYHGAAVVHHPWVTIHIYRGLHPFPGSVT